MIVRRWLNAFVAIFCTLSCLAFAPAFAQSHGERSVAGLADGPGIWMNLWSYPDGDIETYVLKLHNTGIRNLFVQTSRSNTPSIRQPEVLGPLIETCHRYKIRVIAWSFNELANPVADAQKMIDAARFQTANGHRFDAIAPNLEKDLSYEKVETYSKLIRAAVGPHYPMIAVVFSPLNKAPQVAKTPWKLLDKYYSVIAPMNYWNSRYAKLEPYSYTRDTINTVRALVGRPDVEIHIIGDGMKTHSDSIQLFLQACRDAGVTSASLYPFHKMTEEQFACLSTYHEFFPVNSRYRLAAFRELFREGAFTAPISDPSKPLTRGEFHQLLASKIAGRPFIAPADAAFLLVSYGIMPSASAANLAGPLGHKEAYALVANAMSAASRAKKMGVTLNGKHPVNLSSKHMRADEWFVLPVMAEANRGGRTQLVNYLDAAQMLVDAKGGFKN
jgi:hypothetical protein